MRRLDIKYGEWVKTTETAPSESGVYLVTIRLGLTRIQDIARYDIGTREWVLSYGIPITDKVIAWTNTPELYTPSIEETKNEIF